GTDSHTTTHGAFGAFATGIGATEMACVWATGKLWLKVPETVKVNISGNFKEFVEPKDLILNIIGKFKVDGCDYKCVEFLGETIEKMSLSAKMTLANMSMEMGAKCAYFQPDDKVLNFLGKKAEEVNIFKSDEDCYYSEEYNFEVPKEPQIACPHSVDNVKPISEVKGIEIDQALLGSCTNGRIEDLERAARIMHGKKISKNIRMIVIPASYKVYLDAIEVGYIKTFIESGCVIVNPGCGPCLGAHQGLLASGEKCISTTNRNFQGRMGSANSEIYLASPSVVASSALAGYICSPGDLK
ncbi:MAG: aconitase/3-isopropylmalate dehydratase large subunit family protein, partial [Candidatus Thermoplasmatota archaeon]